MYRLFSTHTVYKIGIRRVAGGALKINGFISANLVFWVPTKLNFFLHWREKCDEKLNRKMCKQCDFVSKGHLFLIARKLLPHWLLLKNCFKLGPKLWRERHNYNFFFWYLYGFRKIYIWYLHIWSHGKFRLCLEEQKNVLKDCAEVFGGQ